MKTDSQMTALARWRTKNGLTLEELAVLSRYSVSMLSRVERGLRAVPPLKRVEIARRLGVPLREIFPG